MAGTVIRVRLATRRALVGAGLAALLAGCASTDELYAAYDATLCPVIPIGSTDVGDVGDAADAADAGVDGRIRYLERASGAEVLWPPAIYFGYDSDALDAWAVGELEDAARLLNRHPRLNVMLTGYTSRLGSAAYNAKLASRRVARVIDRLDAAGIARTRLLPLPIGMGLPEFTTDSRVANAVNRRVGLTLLDVAGRPVVSGYGEGTLGAGARRVGPDWPPNEVSPDVRGRGAGTPAPGAGTPVGAGASRAAPVAPPLAPLPGPVDPWATGGAGRIGGGTDGTGAADGVRGDGAGGDAY